MIKQLITNLIEYSDSWIVYVLAFAVSLLFSKIFCYLNKRVIQNKGVLYTFFLLLSYFLIALPVAAIIGMRGVDVGYDTYNYYMNYKRIQSGFWKTLMRSSKISEFGFVFIRWISYILTNGSLAGAVFPITLLTVMILTHAFVLFGKDTDVTFGLFMYYCVMGLNLCDQSRQLLACSIVAVGIYYLCNNNIPRFIVIILLAGSVHNTALLFLLLAFVVGMNRLKPIEKFLCFLGGIIGVGLAVYGISNSDYSQYVYILQNGNAISGWAWILDMLPIVIPLILLKGKNSTLKKLKIFSLSAVAFRIMGYVSYFIMRMYYYPAIISWVVAVEDYKEEKKNANFKRKRIIMVVIFVLYFVINYILLLQHNVVPYKRIDSKML